MVGTALDLPVNSASERGLLGIAVQPDFATSHGVYLYWTQSTTGADSTNLAEVPTLGNRVDRFVWDPTLKTLSLDKNIITLHAFQADSATPCCGSSSAQPMRGNHDGGKILFGPDGKLYFQIGDQGRRGQLQNLAGGPFGGGQADDQFGGPAPDDAHLTGAIFRLNPDGTTPSDNPFAAVTLEQLSQLETQAGVTLTFAQMTNVLANIRKIYSYGRRNGFGLAFDPIGGLLWESENGDDAFDEINQITAGSNGGWIQMMGPSSLLKDFKGIESSVTRDARQPCRGRQCSVQRHRSGDFYPVAAADPLVSYDDRRLGLGCHEPALRIARVEVCRTRVQLAMGRGSRRHRFRGLRNGIPRQQPVCRRIADVPGGRVSLRIQVRRLPSALRVHRFGIKGRR